LTELKIKSSDGKIVRIQGNTWYVPLYSASMSCTVNTTFDWSSFPRRLRQSVELFGELVVRFKGVKLYSIFAYAMQHLADFVEDGRYEEYDLCLFTETEWGAFAEWLESRMSPQGGKLALSTRRGYFTALKLALKLAVEHEVPGYEEQNISAIESVMRRRFRDANLLAAQRGAKRAWSEKERENLLEILRLEWLAWKDWYQHPDVQAHELEPPNLPVITAVYLCWEETLRPEEINAMNVEDIDFDNNKLFVHAPNKPEGTVSFGPVAKALLKALVKWGEPARQSSK
jgi:integrase